MQRKFAMAGAAPGTGGNRPRSNVKWLVVAGVVLLAAAIPVAFMLGQGSSKSSTAAETLSANGGSGVDSVEVARRNEFRIEPDATTFAGPVPMRTSFSVDTKKAKGDVSYRWNFDDGTTATGASPTHVYKQPGWRVVKVTAKDSAGRIDRFTMLLHPWSKQQWYGLKKASVGERQAAMVKNLQALERKTGSKIPGISAAPAPGQQPLTQASLQAQKQQRELSKKAQP